MPFFDPLVTPSLLILAASSPTCGMPRAADITIVPQTAPIHYDYTQTLAQLKNQIVDTVSPYGQGQETRTQGMMSGSLKVEPAVNIGYKVFSNSGMACLWYDKIKVSLSLAPTIVLAREVFHDPCMRQAVDEHEMMHVAVDRRLVNKYAKIIGDEIYNTLNAHGFSAGPVAKGEAKAAAAHMQETVFQIVSFQFHAMAVEQRDEQQKIDSLQEYERVNHLCPDFRNKYAVRKAYQR